MTDPHSAGAAKIGSRIREARENWRISLEDLSFLTGLELAELESIEQGTQELSTESVIRIAGALEIDAATLVADLRPTDFDRG